MKLFSLLLTIGLAISFPAKSIIWPMLTEAKITSCSDENGGTCNKDVFYSGSISFVEIGQPVPGPQAGYPSMRVQAVGIHCKSGSQATGFKDCIWSNNEHAPPTWNCVISDKGGWDIKDPSACASGRTWGPHSGAEPGGECVLFGIGDFHILYTPFGTFDSNTVANSGNRFCLKPLPPTTQCSLSLTNNEIDHGLQLPTSDSQRTIYAYAQCGNTPSVFIVGSEDIHLAEGVTSHITVAIDAKNRVAITSNLVTRGALPGSYNASLVVGITPP